MEKLNLEKFEDFSAELNSIHGGRNNVWTDAVVTGCDDGSTSGDPGEDDGDLGIAAHYTNYSYM